MVCLTFRRIVHDVGVERALRCVYFRVSHVSQRKVPVVRYGPAANHLGAWGGSHTGRVLLSKAVSCSGLAFSTVACDRWWSPDGG